LYNCIPAGDSAECEVVEGAAVYLVEVFKSVNKVGQKETNSLKSVFGPFPASVATKACAVINRLTSSLPEEVIALLGNPEREEADGAASVNEFGTSIKFVLPSVESVDDDLSSSESEDEQRREVNYQYTASEPACTSQQDSRSSRQEPAVDKGLDSAWLQHEVASFFGTEGTTELGLSVEDLSSTIYDFLSSNKSDSELQNDVS